MRDWYWLRVVLGLGLAGVATRIFLDDAEAHVTMCMLAAALYGVGLMIPDHGRSAQVTSLAFFGIAFYTVYAATTFLAFEQFFAGPSFSPDDQIVPGIDFAWVYHTIINFYLLGLFWLGLDRMRTVTIGFAVWLMAAPLMFLFAAIGRPLWLDYEPPAVIIGYTVVGILIALVYRWLKSKPELLDRILAGFRRLIIVTLWIYVVISLIPYVQFALGFDNTATRLPAGEAGLEGAPSLSPMSAQPSSRQAGRGSQAACSDGPLFNHLPMELDDFKAFRPLGFIAIPIHLFGAKHSSFAINGPDEHVSGLPVEFPADATVTAITATTSAQGSGYQLVFYPCREFKSYFFHLGTLAPALQAGFEAVSPKCQEFTFDASGPITKCEATVSIAVASGDLVGTNDAMGGVDWGGVDQRVTATYANLSRYDGDYPHYVSPVSYLEPNLKVAMLDKLGSYDGEVKRVIEPRVGTLSEDVPGTAQGNWFVGQQNFRTTQDLSPFLALRHDYVDPTQPVFSMGSSVTGVTKGIYSFVPEATGTRNRDFADVTADGQVYCYDGWLTGLSVGRLPLTDLAGVLLLSLPDATTLLVEHQSGSCQTGLALTDAASTFER